MALRLVGQLGGRARAAAIDGGQLVAGAGSEIILSDLGDAGDPREVTTSGGLPGPVQGLARSGDLLVAAVGHGGIVLLDLAAGMSIRATLGLPGQAEAVVVVDDVAYVADGPGGLRLVDLRDPAAPTELAAAYDLHRVVDVAVDGSRAYLAAADEGLFVVDVSDPAAPRELGRLFTGGYAYGIATHGDRVLLADGWGGLRVIDVSDPTIPRLVTTISTAAWAMGVEVDAGRAYLAAGDELRIFDPADLGAPPVSTFQATGGRFTAVTASGHRAAVVDDTVGVRILDVSGSSPVMTGTFAPQTSANGLAVVGQRAFIAAMDQGLKVIDLSDPTRPREVAGIQTQEQVTGVAASGSNLFFTTRPGPGDRTVGGIFGMDVASVKLAPERPYGEASGTGIAVDGSTLYVAAERGMWILDGSTTRPCEFSYLETDTLGFEANGVAATGELAYIAPYFEQLRVVDVSEPRTPKVLDQAAPPVWFGVGKVLAVGPRLYALGDDGQGMAVAVFDIRAPRSPRRQGSVRLPATTAREDQNGPPMAYGGGRLFVADAAGGLVVVDVADPQRPAIAGRLQLPGEAVAVAVVEDHAYVASNGGGFFVVEWSSASSDTAPALAGSGVTGGAVRTTAALALVAPGDTCLVSTAVDKGPGSLRHCLTQAQAGSRILFDPGLFPADRPATISLQTPLPVVRAGISVDGQGAGVHLDGGGKIGDGLSLEDEATVRGLILTGFTKAGILVHGSGTTVAANVVSSVGDTAIAVDGARNRIAGNLVGLDPSGTRILGSQRIGLSIGGTGNVIGGPRPADRNVVIAEATAIFLKEAMGAIIQGNYVGTDAEGRSRLGPPEASQSITVAVGSAGNTIAGNTVAGGINLIDPGVAYNAIVGNHVGFDATGTRPLAGGGSIGVSEPFNRVGGTLPGEANFVNGAIVADASDVLLLGNRLGVDRRGNASGSGGIAVGRPRAVVGGRSPGAANVVAGGGIEIRGNASVVAGNRVRLAGRQVKDVGIRLAAALGIHLIANVIEGGRTGIQVSEGSEGGVIRGNHLRANRIGLLADASSRGTVIIGNSFSGNTIQARDLGRANRWDDGRRGNFWTDLKAADADGDGIIDGHRPVAPNGVDHFPLARPP